MTAANRIGWFVAVVVCAGSALPACSPEPGNSGSVGGGNETGVADGGSIGAADAEGPSATDGGSAGATDAGSPDASDAGSPDASDAGSPDATDAESPDATDAESPDATDGGSPDATDGGSPGAADAGNETVPDEAAFGQKYKFSDNEIADWKQATVDTAYSVWTNASLFDKDGAAIAYVSHGCQMAMYQDLEGPNSKICTVVAMDFGTDADATSMFEFQQQQTETAVTIPSYDSAVAFGAKALTGTTTVFAHFKASYFELRLGGYPDQASAAQAAPHFLDVLKNKTQ